MRDRNEQEICKVNAMMSDTSDKSDTQRAPDDHRVRIRETAKTCEDWRKTMAEHMPSVKRDDCWGTGRLREGRGSTPTTSQRNLATGNEGQDIMGRGLLLY